ncbi:MAG: endonuclease NucS domain-containing protein [Kineosporiaceae bacterium]
MPVEMGMWRLDGDAPRRLTTATLPSEAALEEYLERDPSLLGQRLLIIGRQVRTPHGKYIDLLAMDSDGNLSVLELKRDKTPREVVAQILDYGSWVSQLDRDDVTAIAESYLGRPFEVAFEEVFDAPPPDDLNSELSLTIVATDLDPSSERIVTYLRSFGVPINALFFSHLEDDGRHYLARSWLRAPDDTGSTGGRGSGKRADWNGRDWYVSFGDNPTRAWQDGRRHGFVSAGGGAFYSGTLRGLPVGARVFVHVPKRGYVGVGITIGEARRADEVTVPVNDVWTPMRSLELAAAYALDENLPDDQAEWVVPVRWLASQPLTDAYWEKGLFANQNSACKLRQAFTIDRVTAHFRLGDDSSE